METKFKFENLEMDLLNTEFLQQRRENCTLFPFPEETLDNIFQFIFSQIPLICWVDKKDRERFSESARNETFINIERKGNEIQKWSAKIPLSPGGWDGIIVTMNGQELSVVKRRDARRDDEVLVKIPLQLYKIFTSKNNNM